MTETAALVLVGHGATRNRHSRDSVLHCAERLQRGGRFKEVHAAFLKEPPCAADVLSKVSAETVYVVPYFAYRGYIVDTLIPQAMGLDRPVTDRRVTLCAPVGDHPAVIRHARNRLRDAMAEAGLSRDGTAVLVIGHGTERDPRSAAATRRLAASLVPLAAEAPSAFLDQDPGIERWPDLTDCPDIVVLPYLMAAGLHGGEDVPARLGIDSAVPRLADPARSLLAGPFAVRGRRLWLMGALGADPAMDAVVLARVGEQARIDATAA